MTNPELEHFVTCRDKFGVLLHDLELGRHGERPRNG